jgi:hypothetical protein
MYKTVWKSKIDYAEIWFEIPPCNATPRLDMLCTFLWIQYAALAKHI